VLLVEGIRKLPTEDHALLVKTGTWLAKQLPSVKFRSGNADGSDTAFAEGVCAVDPKRMEYVIPAEGSGRKRRMSAARSVNLTELPKVAETRIEEYTATASPDTKGLIE